MITCKKCKKFAKFSSIKINKFTEQWKEFKVECKQHGITDGDFDDFEELNVKP